MPNESLENLNPNQNLTVDDWEEILDDLYEFYMTFIASRYKDIVEADHINELSELLTMVYLGDIERLCVAMPPRHSKSSMVTLAFPLWLIFQDPDLNILIVNNSATLSEKFGIQLKEAVARYGEYFNVYLSDVKHAKDHLMFCDREGTLYQGSIRLVGASGSITGQDADYIIIDDPYKGFDDITPTLLQKKVDWFDTIIEQRIEPQTKLVLLHTRWSSGDLQGVFKRDRADDYYFIEFAAIKDDGTPLWPERYSIEVLEKKRESVGERVFQSIYQQKPIDDTSDFFDLSKIHWYRPDMETIQMGRGYDIASSDPGKNDYTAGVPMYVLDDNKSVLITDYLYGQFGKNTKNTVKDQVHFDGHDNINVIETGVAAAGQILFDEWEEQLIGYFVERGKAVPNNSKADRATPLKNKIFDGEVYVDIADDKLRQIFINEFKAFPNGQNDDIVDATSHIFNYLNDNFIGDIVFDIVDL